MEIVDLYYHQKCENFNIRKQLNKLLVPLLLVKDLVTQTWTKDEKRNNEYSGYF